MHTHTRRSFLPCILLLVAAFAIGRVSVHAHTTSAADTAAVLLREVAVSARSTPRSIRTLEPTQSLSAASIKDLGIQSLADAVRRFAGVTVRDYGGIGGLKTISVRSLGAAHTAVSYDGVPVSNCQGGQIDLSRFSLDNVSQISLAIGSPDDMLQPARLYAAGAVLAIDTHTPLEVPFEGECGIKGGSFGYVSPLLKLHWRPRENNRADFAADFTRADGQYPFTLENGNDTRRLHRTNSDINALHAEASYVCSLSRVHRLATKAYCYVSERGLPGSIVLYNPVSTQRLTDRDIFVQSRYDCRLSEQWRLRAIAKYTYGYNSLAEHNPKFADGYQCDRHTQHEGYVSACALWQPSAAFSLSGAQDLAVNTLASTVAVCPDPTRLSSLTAMAARIEAHRFTARASMVCTRVREWAAHGPAAPARTRLTPAAAVAWKLPSAMPLMLRAMYKNAWRLPSFNDLYYDRATVRTLRPESAHECNLGLTATKALGSVIFNATADAFLNMVHDKIVAFPSTYNWKMVNYGRVRITGFDATASAHIALAKTISCHLSAAYTWQHAVNRTDPTAKEYGHQLPYTPRHSGNASITIDTPWLTLGYSALAVGKRYYLSQNLPANAIAAYLEQNLALTRRQALGKMELTLTAEISNLADSRYEVIKYYPMPGRSWRVGANLKF